MRNFRLAFTLAVVTAFVQPLTLVCQEDSTQQPKKSESESTRPVTPPRLIHSVDPEYDKASRKKRVQGTVVLAVLVTESGEPQDPKIVTSLNPALDEKAIEAVSRWRFAPATTKDGKPVAVQVRVEVNFHLY